MAENLPVIDDPYAAAYEIAKKKKLKEQEDVLKSTAETYGARGRFYSGILPKQETKIKEDYGQQLSDMAAQIAIERAAEEKAAQRTQEAREYQTSERTSSQEFAAAQNVLGRQFSTSEREAVQEFQALSANQQRDWQSAEAALGRQFTEQERKAIQAWQTSERTSSQDWQTAETALGRTFTTQEREAVQTWQEAQTAANQAWQTLENNANRAITTAEILGYFGAGQNVQYTLAGKQQQATQAETAEQQATATNMGFKSIADMNAYSADPDTARQSGIYSNMDKNELRNIINSGHIDQGWLRNRYKLTIEQAAALVNSNFA